MSAGPSMSPVDIVDLTPRLAAAVRRQVGYAAMSDVQRQARPLLEAALRAAGVAPDGPRLTIWRSLEGGLVDYAPAVFVAAPIAETADVTLLTLPAGRAAHLRLSGSYAGLPAAWETLFAGCAGRPLAGLNWEIYTAAGPEGGETDLYAPLAEGAGPA